jgi:peptide-methionine (R)-S-oxide reductase
MKNILFLLVIIFLTSCSSKAQDASKKYKIVKTEAQWKKELTDKQYYILRESGIPDSLRI